MLNRDPVFKRHDVPARPPVNVNVTPALGTAAPQAAGASRNAATPPGRTELPLSPERPGSDHPTGSRLTVGPDIKLKGVEITDCDTLVVEGAVEASMDSRVVHIAEHGVFKGTVCIDIAEIRGRFEGELTAREQLIIHATGRVSGKIRYGRIKIEEGGEICGDLARVDASQLRITPAILKNALAGD